MEYLSHDREFNLYYNCEPLLISIKFPIKLFKRSKVIYHQAGDARGQRSGYPYNFPRALYGDVV